MLRLLDLQLIVIKVSITPRQKWHPPANRDTQQPSDKICKEVASIYFENNLKVSLSHKGGPQSKLNDLNLDFHCHAVQATVYN